MFSKTYLIIVSYSIYQLQKNIYHKIDSNNLTQKYNDLLSCYYQHHPNHIKDNSQNIVSKMNFQDVVLCQKQYFDFLSSYIKFKNI